MALFSICKLRAQQLLPDTPEKDQFVLNDKKGIPDRDAAP
jgi:hypothetical protein